MRIAALLLLGLCQDDAKRSFDRLVLAIENVDEKSAGEAADAIAAAGVKAIPSLLRALERCTAVAARLARDVEEWASAVRKMQPDPGQPLAAGDRERFDRLYVGYCNASAKCDRLVAVRAVIGRSFGKISATAELVTLLKGNGPERVAVAEALGRVGDLAAACALADQLPKEKDALVRVAIIEALAARGARFAAKAVAERLTDEYWRAAVAAARMLESLRALDEVPALIAALDRVDGRVKDEVNAVLVTLTGVDRHGNAAAWRDWWDRNGDAVRAGTRRPEAADRGAAPEGATTFYGVPITSRRLLFVLDASNSMAQPAAWKPPADVASGPGRDPAGDIKLKGGRKIDVAKYELKRALAKLPDGTRFNIVFFNHFVWPFGEEMATLDRKSREKAFKYIDEVGLVLGTDVYESMKKAFTFAGVGRPGYTVTRAEVDTVYLLSDGQPWLREDCREAGVVDPLKIRAAVKEWNARPSLVIHTIGIETKDGGRAFLKGLAEDNRGTFTER